MLVCLQAATVAVAGATDPETVKMFRSLVLIGPTAFRGHTNSLMLNAWAYVFGAFLDSVSTSHMLRLNRSTSVGTWEDDCGKTSVTEGLTPNMITYNLCCLTTSLLVCTCDQAAVLCHWVSTWSVQLLLVSVSGL